MSFEKLRNHIHQYIEIEDSELETIINTFSIVKYPTKTYILKKCQICNFIGFVNEGCVEYHSKVNRKEQVISFPRESWWIGDLNSLLSQTPTNIYIKTLEDTQLLVVDKDKFVYLIETYRNFLIYYLKIIHYMYMNVSEQYALVLSHSGEDRYNKLMENSPDLINRVSDKHLASYLGIQPPSLSRIKRKKIMKGESF